jgi:DNA-binding NarL/FixJ family response regulator
LAVPLIRVAIVDDHPVVAEGTAAILRGQPDLDVVGVATSIGPARASGLLDPRTVDVVLLDLRLGADSGLGLLAGRSPTAPAGRGASGELPAVIVLTAYDYPQYVEAALQLGAAGFVLKTAPLSDLVEAIRRVAAGGLAFAVRPGSTTVRLTRREHDVVRLVAEGRTNDEIGATLGIGTKTVETHLARLFERLGVGSRTELATRAVREGWLDVPWPNR